jgi:hypothetical protein
MSWILEPSTASRTQILNAEPELPEDFEDGKFNLIP